MSAPVWSNVIHIALIGSAAAAVSLWRGRKAQKEMARAFNVVLADQLTGVARPDGTPQFAQGVNAANQEIYRRAQELKNQYDRLSSTEKRGEQGRQLAAKYEEIKYKMKGTNADADIGGIQRKRATEIDQIGDLETARKAFGRFGVAKLDVKLKEEFDHWDWLAVTIPSTLALMFVATLAADSLGDWATGTYAGAETWKMAAVRALFVSFATTLVLTYLVIANPPKSMFTVSTYAFITAIVAIGTDFILESFIVTPPTPTNE
jgi:hypothetical protein